MRFLSILLVQAALAILCLASPMATTGTLDHSNDGVYLITNYRNGTSNTTKLSAAQLSTRSEVPTAEHVVRSSNALNKRYTVCKGRVLDPWAVERSVNILKNWAGVDGHFLTSSADSTQTISATWGSMQAYYCINAHAQSGNLNIDDINYAMWQMMSNCVRYTSAFWKWDGTVEIVGIDHVNTRVCEM